MDRSEERSDKVLVGFHHPIRLEFSSIVRLLSKAPCLPFLILFLFPWSILSAQEESEVIQDITGAYHFLSADDTLGLLEEEGKLKGYIDVYQGEEESDAVLEYQILQGTRKKAKVEFRTNRIHQRYYRFSGETQRGAGHEETEPDYLRLVGDLEIVTVKADTGEEVVQRMHVVFKSLGKNERADR